MSQFLLKNIKIADDGKLIEKDILVKNNHIAKIENDINLRKVVNYNYGNFLAIPGLINTHIHPKSILFKGYNNESNLAEILSFLDNQKMEDNRIAYWASLATAIEAIKTGTTCIASFGSNINSQIKAFNKIGIRANITLPLYDYKNITNEKLSSDIKNIDDYFSNSRSQNLIIFSIGVPKIIDKCDKIFSSATQIQRDKRCKFFIHLGEDKNRYSRFLRKYGASELDYIDKIGLLNEDLNVIHGLHLSKKDLKKIIDKKARIIHCPTSNIKMKAGLLNINPFKDIISLGTNGALFSNSYNILNEAKVALLFSKIFTRDRIKTSDAFRFCIGSAATTLGLETKIGQLKENYLADIVLYDLNQFPFVPNYNIYSNLIYNSSEIRPHTVIINGKFVLKQYKLTTAQEAKILSKIVTFRDDFVSKYNN